jgi:hypothetical protein
MSDKPYVDSSNLEAMAYGIFTDAPDVETGRDALVQAYDTYNWSDPVAANKTLSEYGTLLKQKFKDQSQYGDETPSIAPIKVEDISMEGISTPQEFFDRYEEENLQYLNKPDLEPAWAVRKEQLIDDVKAFSASKRQEANVAEDKAVKGDIGAYLSDMKMRFIRGLAAPASPVMSRLVGVDTNDKLTEFINPKNDGWIGGFVEAAGNVSGIVTAGVVAGPIGSLAVIGSQGIGAVADRYSDTLRKTGDESLAIKARNIEAKSQGMQAVADAAVFGPVNKAFPNLLKSLSRPVVAGIDALVEGGSEAWGQYISNRAENIETAKPEDQNLDRNVFQSGVTGAVLAGGFAVINPVPLSVPSKGNTQIRGKEAVEYGYIVTPMTKQVIGEMRPKEEPAPADGTLIVEDEAVAAESTILSEEDVINPNDMSGPLPKSQDMLAFEDEAGNQIYKTAENQYAPEGADPHDLTYFATPENLKTILGAIDSGEHIVLTDEGPAIEKVDEAGAITMLPLKLATEGSKDTYPIYISRERSNSKGEKERPLNIGRKIKTVYPPSDSAGAASIFDPAMRERKETKYSKDLRASTSPEGLKKGVGVREYMTRPNHFVNAYTERFVTDNGVEGTISAFERNEVPVEGALAISNSIHNILEENYRTAAAVGDLKAMDEITADLKRIDLVGTKIGQGLQSGNVVKRVGKDLLTNIEAIEKVRDAAVATAASQEGVSPADIENADLLLDNTKKAIEITQSQIETEQAKVEVPQELTDLNQAISEIEVAADEVLQEDLSTIEENRAGVVDEIATIEKRAVRAQRKESAALEQAVVKDSEELIKALNDAADLKEATTEEVDKLNESINKSSEALLAKSSKELSQAVEKTRAVNEEIRAAKIEKADLKVAKEEDALKKAVEFDTKQRNKLRQKESDLKAEGKDIADVIVKLNALDVKTQNAVKRLELAKAARTQLDAELDVEAEANQETENLLNALESGLVVKVIPQGKNRSIRIQTKEGATPDSNGLDLTKIFANKKSEAYGPLSILSKAVNELTGTIRQSLGAKVVNNARIDALNKRINENKVALEKTRSRDTLSAAEKATIEKAKKRLAELDKAKTEATLESRIPKSKKKAYKEFKERKAAVEKGPKVESPATKAAKERLAALKKEQAKAERLAAKKREADEIKRAEAAKLSVLQKQIIAAEQLLEDPSISDVDKAAIKAHLAVLKGVNITNPTIRELLHSNWLANLIGAPVGITVGQLVGALDPAFALFRLTGPTGAALFKNIAAGDITKYKYPLIDYLRGLTTQSKDARARGITAMIAALKYGERLKNRIPRKELVAKTNLTVRDPKTVEEAGPTDKEVDAFEEYRHRIEDWWNTTSALKYGDYGLGGKVVVAASKLSGVTAGSFLRVMMAAEALTYSLHDSGYDRAAAAIYYNRDKASGVSEAELMKYQYSPEENWTKAQVEAKVNADKLRAQGIVVPPYKEFLSAVQKYQSYRPREVEVSAYKAAGSVGLNSPATGVIGMGVELINAGLKITEGVPVLQNTKYLIAFANSIGVMLGRAVELTPLALIGLGAKDKLNRTYMERQMMLSSSITGTATAAGIALLAIQNLELPEDERWFDLIGNYSADPKKRQAFIENGGSLYSIKLRLFGKTIYFPFGETPFVLALGGAAAATDRVRDGKNPDPESATGMMMAGFDMAAGIYGGIANISMLRGITTILDGIKDAGLQKPGADVKIARALFGTVKGMLPASSIQRNIARYSDNPVDAKKDLLSALVEGIPYFQSKYGKPALNMMFEPLGDKAHTKGLSFHRLFTSQGSDVDMRWLNETGYTMEPLGNMAFSDAVKNRLAKEDGEGARKADYELRHKVATAIGQSGARRNVITKYRKRYGNSAPRPEIQKAINAEIAAINASYMAKEVFKR